MSPFRANAMSLSLWLDNLVAYSIQIAVLISAGTLLDYVLRLRKPTILLHYWQLLLLGCFLLPGLQPWKQSVLQAGTAVPGSVPLIATLTGQPAARAVRFSAYETVALIIAAGTVLRLLWLLAGLVRLSTYRSNSRLIAGIPPAIEEMRLRIDCRPEIYISTEMRGPVTFGFGRSAIIFPASFLDMEEKLQRPLACHELLHVRRHDWLFVVLEDVLCALFWFHPAIWWAVSRIRLCREQTVDQEVLAISGERKPYLESLLQIASTRGRPAALPAPLFLRESHLAQRVALMLQEVVMSKTRLFVSLFTAIVLLLCTARLASAWFPLNAPAVIQPGSQQEAKVIAKPLREPIRVGGNVQESKLQVKVNPVYPEQAKAARVSGVVILQVTVNEAGEVYDVKVLRGHPMLDDAAIEAVRQWRYSPTLLNGEPVPVIATVTVIFNMQQGLSVMLDEAGNLRDPVSQLQGADLLQKIKQSQDGVVLQPLANVPMSIILATIKALQNEGVQNIRVMGFLERNGKLYATVQYGIDTIRGNTVPPVLALDKEALTRVAIASGSVDNLPPGLKPLIYRMFINEIGEIVAVEPMRGPQIPALENELMRTRVVSPAMRGGEAVPAVFQIEVPVP